MSALDGLPPLAEALQFGHRIGKMESDVEKALRNDARLETRIDHIDQTMTQMGNNLTERMSVLSNQLAVLISRLETVPAPPQPAAAQASPRLWDVIRHPVVVVLALLLAVALFGPNAAAKMFSGVFT